MVGISLIFLIGVIIWSLGLLDGYEEPKVDCSPHEWIIDPNNGTMWCNKCSRKPE